MKIIILGGGKVGQTICQELEENDDIILIDRNPQLVGKLFHEHDIQVVLGNGADIEVLREAGAQKADIFIAVTDSDELNMIACIIAKQLGSKKTIARVRRPEFTKSVDFIRSDLGISEIINPEETAANQICEILKFPTARSIETFARGKVHMVEMEIDKDAFMVGMKLKDFRRAFKGVLIVCIIERAGRVMIPTGENRIEEGDIIYVTGSSQDLNTFYITVRGNSRAVDSVLIVGAGRLTHYILENLTGKKRDIKVIEKDKEKAMALTEAYPEVVVINEDGTDQEVLDGERMEAYESCIALTGFDEENIMITLYAKARGVRKAIAKVNRTPMLKLLKSGGLDTTITPKQLVADQIVKQVRSLKASSGSSVENLYKLADRKVEALEFIMGQNSPANDQPLIDLKLKENTLVVAIYRDNRVIYPGGLRCAKDR